MQLNQIVHERAGQGHPCTHARTHMGTHTSADTGTPPKDPHLDPVRRKAEEHETPSSPPLPHPLQGLGGAGGVAVSVVQEGECDVDTALEEPASSDGAFNRA